MIRKVLILLSAFVLSFLLSDVSIAAPQTRIGGGGGGNSGSPGVGSSGVQSSSPGNGSGPSRPDICYWFDDTVPGCGSKKAVDNNPGGTGVGDCCACVAADGTQGKDIPTVGGNGQGSAGDGGAGDGGAGGCTPCNSKGGSDGNSGQIDFRLLADGLTRYFVPNNRASNSSFSPGHYSQFDNQLEFFPGATSTAGNVITFFDAEAQSVYRLVDGMEGDTLDGVYKDTRNNHVKQLTLLTSTGTTTSTISSAVTAKVDSYFGMSETYQLVDLDPSPTAATLVGRFTGRTDLDGRQLTVNYKTWTPTEISQSPSRQWQINTVTDSFTNQLTFTYGATQVGGRWAVSRVDRNDGKFTTYTYANNALASVANNAGTVATLT